MKLFSKSIFYHLLRRQKVGPKCNMNGRADAGGRMQQGVCSRAYAAGRMPCSIRLRHYGVCRGFAALLPKVRFAKSVSQMEILYTIQLLPNSYMSFYP